MFCDGLGSKFWSRHRSKVTNETPYLVNVLNAMNEQPNDNNKNEGTRNAREALSEPGVSLFFNRSCALKEQSFSSDGFIPHEVLQSSNA